MGGIGFKINTWECVVVVLLLNEILLTRTILISFSLNRWELEFYTLRAAMTASELFPLLAHWARSGKWPKLGRLGFASCGCIVAFTAIDLIYGIRR